MVQNNKDTKDGLSFEGNVAEGEHRHHQPYGSGFAPQYQQPIAHNMPPLAPPPKKAKLNHHNESIFSPEEHIQGSQYMIHKKSDPSSAANFPHPAAKRCAPQVVAPPTPLVLPKPVTLRNAATSELSPLQQNPYSTSRGLRHFSMKVCEKVEERGTTTYNEVADELVRELKEAEEAINKAAAARGEVPVAKKSKKASNGKTKKNHDDKNIRRRVYDALNVLMAMDIITKDKKEITWRGLPGSRVRDDRGGGAGSGDDREACGSGGRRRVRRLREELAKRREDIRRKRECLQELVVQNVCFRNLLGRNHAREQEERTGRPDRARRRGGSVAGDRDDACEAKEGTGEKIQLPFLVVNTDSRAVVQCEMCPERTNVSFDFSLPFEINDDNEILKRLGMNHTSKEALQRSLPPDLFHYVNNCQGMLQGIVLPR